MRSVFLIIGLFVSTLVVVADDKPTPKFDLKKLTGTWEYVKVQKGGTTATVPGKAAYIHDQVFVYSLAVGEFIMSFDRFAGEAAKEKNVEKIELVTLGSPFGPSANKMPALLMLDDKELVLCYKYDPTFQGKKVDFPTAVESTEANQANLIRMKRTSETVPDEVVKKIAAKKAAKP